MKKIAIIALAFSASAGALAQSFPAKPVRLVVAFPAGGGVDIVARLLSPKLAEAWGQQVIVDNRAGASGAIGTEFAARSAPDGHTLLIGTLGNLAVNQHLIATMPVDPLRDFAPITQVVAVHFVLVANPALPARSVPELIALARSRPGQLNYSSSGPGGAPHLAGELFKSMAKVNPRPRPVQGQRAELPGPARRSGVAHLRQPRPGAAVHTRRPAQGARGARRGARIPRNGAA